MTPEYKFNIEGLVNKEKIVGGLMDSGYVVSVKKRFNDLYEISVYGKERVDGQGMKPTDFVSSGTYIKTPSTAPNTTPIPWVTSTTSGSVTATFNCDPKFLVETEEQKQRNKETIINAIQRDHGC